MTVEAERAEDPSRRQPTSKRHNRFHFEWPFSLWFVALRIYVFIFATLIPNRAIDARNSTDGLGDERQPAAL